MDMEEKVIISGNKNNYMLITLIIALVGVLVFFVTWQISAPGQSLFEAISELGLILLLPFIVLAAIYYFWVSKMEITVTNKRVYGKAAFGTRIDLPLDSVSAVGTSFMNGIDVGTSSGRIHFKMISNNKDIHKVLSELLIQRQHEKNVTMQQSNIESNATSADELKKYKELLDAGVITQEEFDAKKKQLLGL